MSTQAKHSLHDEHYMYCQSSYLTPTQHTIYFVFNTKQKKCLLLSVCVEKCPWRQHNKKRKRSILQQAQTNKSFSNVQLQITINRVINRRLTQLQIDITKQTNDSNAKPPASQPPVTHAAPSSAASVFPFSSVLRRTSSWLSQMLTPMHCNAPSTQQQLQCKPLQYNMKLIITQQNNDPSHSSVEYRCGTCLSVSLHPAVNIHPLLGLCTLDYCSTPLL